MSKSPMLTIINIILTLVIIVLIVAIVSLLWLISPMRVEGDSMRDTLHDNDIIWVQKVNYKLSVGDIIVFQRPTSEGPPVKRIIAMEGDTVLFDKQQGWIVNGKVLEENYLTTLSGGYIPNYLDSDHQDPLVKTLLTTTGLIVKKDELFVLGDNRNVSFDSHVYGCINKSWIIGKVLIKTKE